MTVSHSSSTTSFMPQLEVPRSAPSIWGTLTSLLSPARDTQRHEESQHIKPERSIPLFLSSQTSPNVSSPDDPPPSQMTGFSPAQLVAHSSSLPPMACSSPSRLTPGSSSSELMVNSSSQLAGSCSPLPPVTSSSPARPVKGLPSSEPVASSSKQPRSPSPLSPEKQSPSLIVRDFAYMPRPPLLNRPIDKQWVVNIMLPPGAVPGVREREAVGWEASHRHLYRLGGNRADPPNTIPKTWGGLSKAEDDEMMRRALEGVREARQRTLALGLTPTVPNIGAPPQNYLAMTDEEREAIARVDASIRRQIAMAAKGGYEPLIKTPPNTPPPFQHTNTRVFSPSPSSRPRTPLSDRTSPRHSKRKREESDNKGNEDATNEADTSGMRPSRKRRTEKQDAPGIAPSRYFLRRRVPSSPSRTTNAETTASSNGKGKARMS